MTTSPTNTSATDPDKAPPSWLVWAALWVVYIVWGSTYLAIRVTVETLPPLLSAGVRFLIAGGLMYLFLLWRKGGAGMKVSLPELGGATFIGAALLLGGNGMVSIAEQHVPSGLTALIIASVPLWVILFRFLTGDRIPLSTLVGVAVGFVGVAILMLPGERPDGVALGPLLLVVLAAFSWAIGSFFSKRVALPSDPFVSTAVQMVCGGAVMVLAGLARGEGSGLDPASFSTASLLGLVYLVAIGSWFAFTAYVWLLQNAPISKVATYAYVNPVVAIFLGWLILSEQITVTIVAGAAIIVASVAAIVRRESGAPPSEPQQETAHLADVPATDVPPKVDGPADVPDDRVGAVRD